MNEERQPYCHERTLELILKAQQGDELSREELVVGNAALVKSIIRKYIGRGVEYDDLYQIGCIGLIKAINNFDTSFNVRFSTYAVPMIAGEVKRFIRDDGMIKVSRSLKELAIKAVGVQERLTREHSRAVGVAEIAKELNEDAEEVALALEAMRPHASIYEPAYSNDDSDALMVDKIACAECEEETTVNKVLLKELLGTLEPRERQLIMLRYFGGKTQTEIAAVLGISQVQVSRMESRILKRLREIAKY